MTIYRESREHVIKRLDIAPAVGNLTFSQREALEYAVLSALQAEYTSVPDINGLYPFHLELPVDDLQVTAICKPRTFRQATFTLGWYVGILTPNQFVDLEHAPIETRDKLMIEQLCPPLEAALTWVAHY